MRSLWYREIKQFSKVTQIINGRARVYGSKIYALNSSVMSPEAHRTINEIFLVSGYQQAHYITLIRYTEINLTISLIMGR